ncbi:pectinesterase family protein [Paractinoplanes rishiriensis]|uniref:Pectinesterase n=1 Tax=Paractinoplanes rishiriensis TaxID=1050105 RepID=A0A919K498_9ACTN|nr:pectinesterase family protein [Actinoplanes rishiriensis]GIE99913.1 hypothetical protein Ari01nite_73780 [Actinoplanes rishiriensis]
MRFTRSWAWPAAAAVAAGLVVVAGWPAQAAVAAAAGGTYTMAVAASGKCVQSPDGTAGTQLYQSTCTGAANQVWTFGASTAAAGKYLVRNGNLCMTDKDASTAGNNPIVQQACSDIAQTQWAFNQIAWPTAPTTSPPTGTQPTVAKDGTGAYTTVQAAINAVPAGNTTRRVITIKAGTYREQIKVPADKPFITLQGLGPAAAQTTIVFNRHQGGYGATGSATAWILGKDFAAGNLTFSNDFDENSNASGHQALAMFMDGDRAVFSNTRFLGDQDTLRVEDGNRAYFVNTYVEGTVDFIYSGGTAVFNACQIYEKRASGGPITAASTPTGVNYGFLFYRPRLTDAQAANYTPQKYLAGSDGWNPL